MSFREPHLRKWRVAMKSGETWIVSADKLEPTISNGCLFSVDGRGVVVVPFGTFTECTEIDPASGESPYVQRVPAPDSGAGSGNLVAKTGPKTKPAKKIQMIRSTPAGDDLYERVGASGTVGKLISVLDEEGLDEPLKEVRQRYLERFGGFPPKTYKTFNDDVANAAAKNYIVLSEVDDVED